MKLYWIIFLTCLAISGMAISQDYKSFKVGLGLGLALIDDGTAAGIVTLEPAYRIRDDLAVGLRIEGGTLLSTEMAWIGSYTLNGQYYFNDHAFRPFVGSGLGLYIFDKAADDEPIFGLYPRVGFDLGHFTTLIDYNILPSTPTNTNNGVASYFHLRIGFFVGGGKK